MNLIAERMLLVRSRPRTCAASVAKTVKRLSTEREEGTQLIQVKRQYLMTANLMKTGKVESINHG